MSIESAKLFMEKVNTNLEFCNKVMEFEDTEQLMNFIVKEGFEFTGKELKEVNLELSEDSNQELSDNDLEAVSGGVTMMFQPCTSLSTSGFCKLLRK